MTFNLITTIKDFSEKDFKLSYDERIYAELIDKGKGKRNIEKMISEECSDCKEDKLKEYKNYWNKLEKKSYIKSKDFYYAYIHNPSSKKLLEDYQISFPIIIQESTPFELSVDFTSNADITLEYKAKVNMEGPIVNNVPLGMHIRSNNLFYNIDDKKRFNKLIYPNEFNETNSDIGLYNKCNYILLIDSPNRDLIEEEKNISKWIIYVPLAISLSLGIIGGL
mgnify:FL=1